MVDDWHFYGDLWWNMFLCWFWSKNWWTLEKNKDDCFKMSTCVFRWNPMPYQFWQLAEQITSIRHILETSCCWLFASNISRSKGQLLQAFVTRTNHQCKILWKRSFGGLDKQYIRKLFLNKTMKKRMKLSASRIKLEEEEHNWACLVN